MSLPEPYYDHGGIQIFCGDCRDILLHLPKVDLVLTDPPYGIGVSSTKYGNRKGAPLWDGDADWDATTADVLFLLDINAPTIIWGGNYFGLPPSGAWLVWDKGTGANAFGDCELAWTNLPGTIRKRFCSWVGANAKERENKDRFHPTQKPIDIMRWCIERAGDPQTILDPFMGSGTTLRAAKDLGRRAIGIEIEEKYCEIAANRLAQEVLPFGETQ